MGSAPIDFARLADALLQQADTLVERWLPNGTERNGRWYIGDFDGSPGESANVNLSTGQWIDNAAPHEDKGGDLISLYARIHNLNNGQAARELMRELGWTRPDEDAPVQTPARTPVPADRNERPEPPAQPDREQPPRKKREPKWRAVVPVPGHAPHPGFRFGYKDKKRGNAWIELDAVKTWEYRLEGQLYGYVARFERVSSDGELVKDTVARTWCENTEDDRGLQRWHWKQWETPRPLYVPATVLSGDLSLPVVIVEGEKCAEAGHQLLGHEMDFVSWPGGCKAWALAAWGWLMGRTVYLWPDCDAKRQRLTAAEREQGISADSKEPLPEAKQPGMAAMIGIGSLLVSEFGCTVYLCNIPEPGAVADGWDIADAIAQGWDATRVRDFIRSARAFVPPDEAVRAKAAETPSAAGVSEEELAFAWRGKLLTSQTGAVKAVRENVVLALDGIPDAGLPGIGDAAGVIAFNEFTNDVVKLRDSPWGTPAGVWAEVDELLLGEWLVRAHGLPSMPRGTLEEAVAMVAYRHRYHPVREYLQSIDGTWDREPRLATWLQRVCLEEDEHHELLQEYLKRAGTWFLMGMCQRVLQPGCKFDYMLILEGRQGMRKSTVLNTLAGDWFADTGLVLGDKDSYQQLQGKWLYEMGELDAMGKAEITKVKQYIASKTDYFRASFDRRARDYPRQVVFGGTTNEDHYLVDPTGNRRFWPVRVTRLCDIDWLAQHRDQLFAEALARIRAGKRMHPTLSEERELFEPQQQLRQVENAIGSAISRWLSDNQDGMLCKEITLVEILGKIGIGVEKLGPGRFHEKQASAALRRLGWTDHKSSRPGRPMVWRRPESSPLAAQASAGGSERSTGSPQSQVEERAADECPF